MSRTIDALAPEFRLKAQALLDMSRAAGIELFVVETLRSEAQHKINLAAGKSWTRHSRHQDGLAIDVVPIALMDKPDWAPGDQLWCQVVEIAESLGLQAGARWRQRDYCHFEAK